MKISAVGSIAGRLTEAWLHARAPLCSEETRKSNWLVCFCSSDKRNINISLLRSRRAIISTTRIIHPQTLFNTRVRLSQGLIFIPFAPHALWILKTFNEESGLSSERGLMSNPTGTTSFEMQMTIVYRNLRMANRNIEFAILWRNAYKTKCLVDEIPRDKMSTNKMPTFWIIMLLVGILSRMHFST